MSSSVTLPGNYRDPTHHGGCTSGCLDWSGEHGSGMFVPTATRFLFLRYTSCPNVYYHIRSLSAPQTVSINPNHLQGLAFNLATRGPLHGKPLIVFNRTPQRFYDLQASLSPSDQPKIILADSAEAAAKDADIIFTSLGDDQSVLDMYDKLLAGCNGTGKGRIFVEASTVPPKTAKHISQQVEQLGETYVAMPSELSRFPQYR